MANVEGAYCATEDMRTGDIALPSGTSREQYVKAAAEEIDAALGHLYVTPFVIEETPVNRPTILFLKKLNWLLASGRFVLDVAAAGEQDNLHALGKRYLDEALVMLKVVTSGDLMLTGAEKIDSGEHRASGPIILNEDPFSLVESFYTRGRTPFDFGESYPIGYLSPAAPYGN